MRACLLDMISLCRTVIFVDSKGDNANYGSFSETFIKTKSYLWINGVKASLIIEFVKFNEFFIHVNIRALIIWEYLSCINWSSEHETLVFNGFLNVFNEPVKCFNIFFEVLECSFGNFHFLENLLRFFCVLILHLASYKSRNNQSLVDVDNIEWKIDCSWHGFKNGLFFTIELRQDNDFVHNSNESLIFDAKMIQNIVNSIKLILD